MARHIFPDKMEEYYKADLERNKNRVHMLAITPEYITGKLVHER